MTTVEYTQDYVCYGLGIDSEVWSDMSKEDRIGAYQDKYAELKWAEVQPNRMNPEFKVRLTDALLSGKYKQGKHRLLTVEEDGDHFCCLGVGCDLVKPDGWGDVFIDSNTEHGKFKSRNFNFKEYATVGTLPRPLWEELGLDECGTFAVWGELDNRGKSYSEDDLSYGSEMERISLAQLNDAGFTFAQIVDVIRYFL